MSFSVITPSFRHSGWLKLCIASVADQGMKVEHIVHDAGSDDGTLDWLLKDARVQAFVERDAGMYDAINRGLRRAQGDLLAYLNCDEQYLPGALREVESFFAAHPHVDVLFADTVVVDAAGEYRFHRKVQKPLRWHTRVWPLATLTCATFFRRRVLTGPEAYFDTRYKAIGDGVWVHGLLERGVPMAALGRFTSAFTHTGGNLGHSDPAKAEFAAWAATAPAWLRATRLLWLLHHRLRRLAGGMYSQRPFDYALYTPQSPGNRVSRHVAAPDFRWRQ